MGILALKVLLCHSPLGFIMILHAQGPRVTRRWTLTGTQNQQLSWIVQKRSLKNK